MGEQSVKEFYQKQIQEAENKKVLLEKEIDDVKRKCRILRDNIRKIRTELLTESDIGNSRLESDSEGNQYCPNCGNYAGDDIFCRKCGTRIK